MHPDESAQYRIPPDGYAPPPGEPAPGYPPAGYPVPGHSVPGHSVPGHSVSGHSVPGYSVPGHPPAGRPGGWDPAAGHAPADYGPAGYAPAGHAPAGHAPAGYAAAGYSPAGYPPAYGVPWHAPRPSTTWPHGPYRPGLATAAAVMGFVTGGLTALGSLGFLIDLLSGGGNAATGVLAFGLLGAGFLIWGGLQVLGRHGAAVLIGSSMGTVAVLVLGLLVGAVTFDNGDDTLGLGLFVALAASLPVVTGALAATPTVRGWLHSLT